MSVAPHALGRAWRSLKNKLLWPFMPHYRRRSDEPACRKVFILRKHTGEGA